MDPERLAEAVGRVAARASGASTPAPAATCERPLGADDRVFVKDGERMHLVHVRLFESVGNYTRLHFDRPDGRTETPLVRRSLSALEDRLDRPSPRASRTQMIGLAHVVRLDDALNGGLLARLPDGTAVEFSRRRAQALRDRLLEVVDAHGWPTPALIGADGVNAAFMIVQHADPATQERMLPFVEAAYHAGELPGQSYALLLDRVLVYARGEPQVYGTQAVPVGEWVEGQAAVLPTIDDTTLDARRAEVGLPPIADYLVLLTEMYAPSED